MPDSFNRRDFIRTSLLASLSLGLSATANAAGLLTGEPDTPVGKRIGIIGLDVSHSVSFTKLLNTATADPAYMGYKVVAAYPHGSKDIEISVSRIPEFTAQVKAQGVQIVASISELLEKVDVVMLNTNDGRLHLEQALEVFKAGKRLFINKPFAASMSGVMALFAAAERYKVPVFSSSSMRYIENLSQIRSSKSGRVLGADTYSPATLEKSHTGHFWYGIHGVEMLYTILGTGCREVSQLSTDDTDIVVGKWADNRFGTFRGTRLGKHEYGGQAFAENANVPIVAAKGLRGLLTAMVQFFETGVSPVDAAETLEIYAFMAAADESKKRGGKAVRIEDIIKKASKGIEKHL